ncbi:transmembrane protein 40 isoform X2 [Buteo buteo]|uniref:transmembrane protein 40 isoform X2 n=1 Tax=Buteo buteo TaxID=30397 RepID=UPI003EB6C384
MENLNIIFPDFTEEQQDIFQRVFTADASYLENHEKRDQSFWESLVKCLATTDPPILNAEEKNNLLNSCNVLPGGCVACLKAIEKKGVRAMAVLYLLLKTTNPSGYRQLPSSKGKDEKLKLLKRLERNLMLSQGEKKAENSSHESMDEDTQDSDGEDLGRQKTEGQLLGGIPAEVVPYRDSGLPGSHRISAQQLSSFLGENPAILLGNYSVFPKKARQFSAFPAAVYLLLNRAARLGGSCNLVSAKQRYSALNAFFT